MVEVNSLVGMSEREGACESDGWVDGADEGKADGRNEGVLEGDNEGLSVGSHDGCTDGTCVGITLGMPDGLLDILGLSDGTTVFGSAFPSPPLSFVPYFWIANTVPPATAASATTKNVRNANRLHLVLPIVHTIRSSPFLLVW